MNPYALSKSIDGCFEKEEEVLNNNTIEMEENKDEVIKKQLIEYFTGWKDGAKFRNIPVEKHEASTQF